MPPDNDALARPGRANQLPDLSEHPVKQSQLTPPSYEACHSRPKDYFHGYFFARYYLDWKY